MGDGIADRVASVPNWVVISVAVAFAAVCEGVHVDSPEHDIADAAVAAVTAAAFIAAGLLARRRRPDNLIWALLVLVGFALFAEDMQAGIRPLPDTVGTLLTRASIPALTWLVLAFPDGRLENRLERAIVIVAAAAAVVSQIPLLFRPEDEILPWAAFEAGIWDAVIRKAADVVGVVAFGATIVVVGAHWARSSQLARRTLTPFLAVALLGGVAGIVELLSSQTSVLGGNAPLEGLNEAAVVVSVLATALLPFAFLAGLVRIDVTRADAVQAVLALGPRPGLAALRSGVAETIGDPALQILRRDADGGLLDEAGRPAAAPRAPDAVTPLDRDGIDLGLLVHHPALRQDEKLLEAVGAVVADVLDRDRFERDAEKHVAEALQRVERDLHDGAQQKMAAAATRLEALGNRDDLDSDARAELDEIGDEVREAIEDLRLLARGRPPAVLAEQGLDAALQDLGGRVANVEVRGEAGDGLPTRIAAAAYFCAAEGIMNALRHSGAATIEVGVEQSEGRLAVTVDDDGGGGARFGAGTGLSGLRNRVVREGGKLSLSSPAGGGTRLSICLPVAGGAGDG